MSVDCFYFLNGNIVCLLSDGTEQEINQKELEQWMQRNNKLQWQVEDELYGYALIQLTVQQFWEAHDSYKKLMLADYLTNRRPIMGDGLTLFDLLC